jgi:hypothetical protein
VRRRGTRHLGRLKFFFVGLLFPLACVGAEITGTVGAPGGKLALERSFFFGAAQAHVPGLLAVAGATVELTERGKVLASGKTNARGVYTFPAPAGFEPAPRYMVRAGQLNAFVTALRTNIDPATDASARLILEHANVARLRTADVQEVLPLVQHLAWEVDLPAAHSGAALAAMLRTAATNDEEIFNIIGSIGAAGEIHGRVTDAAKNPLARVTILARDVNGLTRATTHTDAQGRYELRVPPGNYTVSAINETAASTAASELGAEPLTVKASRVAQNFLLRPGGRVSGIITGADGARLTNIRIRLGNAQVRTQDDGSYRLNVAPGSYVLVAENTTLQPFASSLGGMRVDIERGGELNADLKLAKGQMISGRAAPGSSIRIEDLETQETAAVLRTNRAGEYRLWVMPRRYAVR